MKKLFTLLLLGGLLFVGASNAWATTNKTIYVAIPSEWNGKTIYCHVWNSGNTPKATWPGESMTNENATFNGRKVYSYTYDADTYISCIFNCGDDLDNCYQTGDLGIGSYAYHIFDISDSYSNDWTKRNGSWQDTYTIYSGWGTSTWAHELFWDGGITKTLSASTEYTFKMCKNMTEWQGSFTAIKWYSASNFNLNQDNNCSLYTNFAGTYTFTNSGFTLTVAYPTQTYTAYFEKPSTWAQVKAHIFRYEDGENRALNTWPGQEITDIEGNYYKATFAATAEPTGIIWNNLTSGEGEVGTSRTSNFTFVEDGIYRLNEVISSYTVNFTPSDGYATFYHPTENILLPAGVTAYSVSYSAPTLGLSAFSGTNADVIPAGLAVILTGTPSGSATLYTTGRTAYTSGSSVLGGSTGSVSGGDYIYVLGTAGNSGTVTGTAFYKLTSGTVPANRAYLDTKGKSAPSAIRLDNGENTTTNLESVENTNNSVKFIKNGQLYIMRDGVVYDVMGRIAE